MAQENRDEILNRIMADLYPHLKDADKLIGEIMKMSPDDPRKVDLGRFLFNKQKGRLLHKASKIDRAAEDALLKHKEDFAKLGIDIEKRLGVK